MERSSGLKIFPRCVGSQNQYSSVKYCCWSGSFFFSSPEPKAHKVSL